MPSQPIGSTNKPASQIEDSSFEGDKLERIKVAHYLTNYVTGKYSVASSNARYRSFVLNINSGWGLGKSYFLTEWQKQLRSAGYVTIFFDAWKNDFAAEPLLSFMVEIESQLRSQLSNAQKTKRRITRLIEKSKGLIDIGGPTLALALFKTLSGLDFQNLDINDVKRNLDLGEVSAEVSKRIKDKLYKETQNTKHAIAAFRTELTNTIKLLKEDERRKLPLFIFVDELDRCRPTFSIRLLEDIKHIFGVEDIYFVIATDSKQLAHSINAVYGNGFDSHAYLRRFFDQEYALPDPDRLHYCGHLFQQFGLIGEKRFFTPISDRLYPNEDLGVRLFAAFADFFKLSLRDQEQACAMLDAIRLTSTQVLHIGYLAFCIMLRIHDPQKFEALRGRQLSYHGLDDAFGLQVNQEAHVKHLRAHDRNGMEAWSEPEQLPLTQLASAYMQVRGFEERQLSKESYQNPSSVLRAVYGRLFQNAVERSEVSKYPSYVHSAEGLLHLTRT